METLHNAFPEARIDLMVRKGNESLFIGHPFLGKLYTRDKKNKYRSLFSLLKKVRNERYDIVINFQRFASSGLLTALSGARETRGFAKNPLSTFFTKKFPHPFGDGTHEIERNHMLVDDLCGGSPAKPKLYPSREDREKVRVFQSEPYICIAPSSIWATKQLPSEKWIELIDRLPDEYTVNLIGGPDDRDLCEGIIQSTSRDKITNLCGKLNFLQSAALMESAAMNYCNDSAPLHLCSAVNAPVTATYCSTIPAFGFGPLSDNSTIVETRKKLACRPCGIHGRSKCPLDHFNCAHSISISELLKPVLSK